MYDSARYVLIDLIFIIIKNGYAKAADNILCKIHFVVYRLFVILSCIH